MSRPEPVRTERQPPRIRKALDCLERLETVRRTVKALEGEHGLHFRFVFTHGPQDFDGLPESLVEQMGTVEKTLAGILTSVAGDEP